MNAQAMIDALLREKAHSLLIISFEDAGLKPLIEQRLPGLETTHWTKADLAGLSLAQLWSRLRRKQWDAVVASMHQSAVNRTRSSIELLLALARASQRWLRLADEDFYPLSKWTIASSVLPRFVFAVAGGTLCILGLYTLIGASYVRFPRRKTYKFARRSKGTVLFIRSDLPGPIKAGGSTSHLKGMMNAFLSHGFRVVYIGDTHVESFLPEVNQYTIKPILLFEVLDELQMVAYNFQLLFKARMIRQVIAPTLIYQRHAVFTAVGGLLARSTGVPFVLEANASEVWVKKHWSRLFFEDLATRCERLSIHLADCLTVISQGVLEMLHPYHPDPKKILINPNGIDASEFHPGIDGAPVRQRHGFTDQIVVGFIGSFTRWHGIETLFDAAEIAAPQEHKLRFLFIGDGEFRSALEKRSLDLGLQQTIIFTGLVPHSEAPGYLAACDILVSPHLGFQDGTKFFGSPTKLFEYMAMGKPIIASRLEQIGEVITDGVNGLSMNPGNAQQLANLILKLARDGELRRRLGAQAREDVGSKYTWRANVERIVKSLESSDS
jgi:glycosyltransferase involved in cell wall biosynthesis